MSGYPLCDNLTPLVVGGLLSELEECGSLTGQIVKKNVAKSDRAQRVRRLCQSDKVRHIIF